MKTRLMLILGIAAVLFTNCTKTEIDSPFNTATVVANMESDAVKSSATDEGYFTWEDGDKIAIHTSEGNLLEGTLISGEDTPNGSFSYSFTGDAPALSGYALYPYNAGHKINESEVTFVMPATYELGNFLSNTNSPMIAKSVNKTASASYDFSHLGGLFRFVINNAPAGADKFTLSLGGKKINGEFTVSLSEETPQIVTTNGSNENNVTTLSFEKLEYVQNIILFIPVPVGYYEGIEAKLWEGDKVLGTWGAQTAKNDVRRRLLINMPAITFSDVEGDLEEGEVKEVNDEESLIEAVAVGGEITLASDITINKPIEVNNDIILDLNNHTLTTAEVLDKDEYSAAIIVYEGNLTVKNGTITTNGTDAHSLMGAIWVRGEKDATVVIEEGTILKGNCWDIENNDVKYMATVYVSNPNGDVYIYDGDFYCVQQTQVEGQNQILNYKNDIETQNIVVAGGTFHGMNPDKGNGTEVSYLAENAVVVETSAGVFEVLSADTEGVITLNEDLTIVSPMVIDGQDIILNLNDHTLTTAEVLDKDEYSAAIIVYEGNLTVMGGTITSLGTSVHKSMGAIWVRGEQEATVTVEEGTVLKGNNWNETVEDQKDGLATVYVSNPNGYAYIEGGEFYCVQQTQVEGQNQILNYKNDFETQNIEVAGGTFHGMNPDKGNGVEVSYLAENAVVVETSAGVFEVLSADTEGVITLNKDLEIVSPLIVNGEDIILDLNNHTLTTAEVLDKDEYSAAIIVYEGNLTVKNGTITTNGTGAHSLMGAIWVRGEKEATVVIEEGTILKGNCWDIENNDVKYMATVYVSNPKGYVYIYDGDFYCVEQTQVNGQNQILNYKNNFTTQNIVVAGGKFHGMNPDKGNGTEVSYLAENAVVVETSAGVFEVLGANTDGIITLNEHLTIVSPMVIDGQDITLNLNGKTLTTAEVISGYSAAIIVYEGNLTVKNGTITTNGTDDHSLMGAIWVRGNQTAKVTIKEGTILKGNCWDTEDTGVEYMATVYVSNPYGYAYVEGGEFYCVKQAQVNGQNQILNYKNNFTTQNIVVTGGKFYGMDPAKGNGVEISYLAKGYVSKLIDGYYVVSKSE